MIKARLFRWGIGAVLAGSFLASCPTEEVKAQETDYKPAIYGGLAANYYAFGKNKEAAIGSGDIKSTFAILQANIFFAGKVAQDWKYLTEVYLLNDQVDQINEQPILQQAWLEWRPSDAFGIRAGRILAPYGLFNQLHTRPSLYWFVTRPFPYEEPTQTNGVDDIRAEFTNFLVSGVVKLTDDIKLDYNFHAGNTGRSLKGFNLGGDHQLGGRIAVRTNSLSIGVSPVTNVISDASNLQDSLIGNSTLIAIDAKAEFGAFTIIGEYINSNRSFSSLKTTAVTVPENHKNSFFFVSAAYSVTEDWLVFAGYDNYKSEVKNSLYYDTPLTRIKAGVNFNATDRVLLKAEFAHYPYDKNGANSYQGFALSGVLSF